MSSITPITMGLLTQHANNTLLKMELVNHAEQLIFAKTATVQHPLKVMMVNTTVGQLITEPTMPLTSMKFQEQTR